MTARSSDPGFRTGRSTKRGDESSGLLREAFDLYSWGYGGVGALGNEAFRDEVAPYLVLTLRAFGGALLVSCGFDHTVVVTGDLRARGWGRAAEGQLDVPADDCVENPAGALAVLAPALPALCRGDKPVSVQALAAGGMHTALITLPRRTDEEPRTYTYGRASEGQLGVAEPEARGRDGRPRPYVKLPDGRVPTLVGCGGLHTALSTEHGHLYTWGHSAHGQTGQSTREAIRQPKRLPSFAFEGRAEKERRRPVVVSAAEEGGRTFHVGGQPGTPLQVACIACGYYHTAACSIEGEVYAWGKNGDGQLGLGDTHDRGFPHLVRGMGGDLALQVACGGRHTLVLSQRGVPWSCGCHAHRQLGRTDGHGEGGLELGPVTGLRGVRVVQVACGGAHSAVLAADGSVYTWGKNQNGQLGLGHADATEAPVLVSELPRRAAWVACGGAHTVALVRLQT